MMDELDQEPKPGGGAGQQPQTANPVQTFARLQQQGVARPAPQAGGAIGGQQGQPAMRPPGMHPQQPHPTQQPPSQAQLPTAQPATPQVTPPPMNGGLGQMLMQHLTGFQGYQNPLQGQMQQSASQLLQNPSAYNSDMVMGTFNRLKQGLDQDFTQKQHGLDDMMAKRGLYDSTMTGQKYSDLATEHGRSLANLSQGLLENQAQQYGADRTNALQAALGIGNQGLNQFQTNQNAYQGQMGQALGYDQNQFGNSLATAQQNNQQQQQQLQMWMQLLGVGQ